MADLPPRLVVWSYHYGNGPFCYFLGQFMGLKGFGPFRPIWPSMESLMGCPGPLNGRCSHQSDDEYVNEGDITWLSTDEEEKGNEEDNEEDDEEDDD
ncbi:hypothetical protein Tco_0694908 [Tanacetum coccineum]